MKEDIEGFKYPVIDESLCIQCDRCRRTCPHAQMPEKHRENKYVFGGYAIIRRLDMKALQVELFRL